MSLHDSLKGSSRASRLRKNLHQDHPALPGRKEETISDWLMTGLDCAVGHPVHNLGPFAAKELLPPEPSFLVGRHAVPRLLKLIILISYMMSP